MKLTGELKEKVEKMDSKEEVKQAIYDAGFELTDDELESVGGGFGILPKIPKLTGRFQCPNCGTISGAGVTVESGVKKCSKCNASVTGADALFK